MMFSNQLQERWQAHLRARHEYWATLAAVDNDQVDAKEEKPLFDLRIGPAAAA